MSLFDKDLVTNENIPLQKFYNLWKNVVEVEFYSLYKNFDGDLNRVSSVYNRALDRNRQKFAEYGMYHPWLSCTPIVGIKPFESKVLVTILYSEDPTIYVHEDAKIFLKLKLNIPSLL